MIQENFIKLYEHSFRENWDLPCYTDYGENESYTYGEVAQEIAKLHLLFKYCSLRRRQNKILFNELYNTSQQYSFIQFLRICLL